jgi:hypothetical protein
VIASRSRKTSEIQEAISPIMPVNSGQRREVHLDTLDDLAAETERIVAANSRGEITTSGNWSAGQILQHTARLITFSIDGFPFQASLPTRILCRILKAISWEWLLKEAFKPGRPLPSATLAPDEHISTAAGAAILLEQLRRIRAGEKMRQLSPFEGYLTHEQWITAQLRHAELHLSYILTRGVDC